jgi:hypothetical protein
LVKRTLSGVKLTLVLQGVHGFLAPLHPKLQAPGPAIYLMHFNGFYSQPSGR